LRSWFAKGWSMPATASEPAHAAHALAWHDRWVIEAGEAGAEDGNRRLWRAASGAALSIARSDGSDLSVVEDAAHVVAFAGVLTNARELAPGRLDPAMVVLAEFAAHGDAAIERLRGNFAVIAWDKTTGDLVAARDHIGIAPLFYANTGARWMFAASPDVLAA